MSQIKTPICLKKEVISFQPAFLICENVHAEACKNWPYKEKSWYPIFILTIFELSYQKNLHNMKKCRVTQQFQSR